MPILRCRRVWFFSAGDEHAFFSFARRIKGVREITGVRDEIHLEVSGRLASGSLRDLLALFARYRISMRQLAQFCTPRNRRWFQNPQAFWFKKVFGNGKNMA